MNEFFLSSVYAGAVLSLAAYFLGVWLKKRWNFGLFNPLLIAIVVTMAVLLLTKVEFSSYNASAKYLNYLLTPATVCLAIPLYQQWEVLKRNYRAVVGGLLAGTLTALVSVFLIAKLCSLSHVEYVTLLPKSITSAIGLVISEEYGGYGTITVAVIIFTGVSGNIFGELICRLFRIREPIAKGLAFGCAAHAIGTTKAMELGEVEGAMSGLAIAVSGVLTVVLFPLFAKLI